MRELGFRAYIKPLKRYATGLDTIQFHKCCDVAGAGIWTVVTANEGIFECDDIVIEQSTGLKDKNGKEIHEGDIVEQFVCGVHQFKGKECGRKTLWQVRWNEEECCFELHYLSGSLFGDSMMSNSDEYEVIGNIHENPELLEEKE